jgi:hypothetical protein
MRLFVSYELKQTLNGTPAVGQSTETGQQFPMANAMVLSCEHVKTGIGTRPMRESTLA